MSIYRTMFDKFNNIIEYIKFFNSWIKFKKIADKELLNRNTTYAEYTIANKKIIKKWIKITSNSLNDKITLKSLNYIANNHILSIKNLGYKLDNKATNILREAFIRLILCNQIPAPFSFASVLEKNSKVIDTNILISLSEHCLIICNYWINNPPNFLTKSELNELIVLSLFHDIFYFDDFINHDVRILKLFNPYIKSKIIKFIVGEHIDLIHTNTNKKNNIEKLIDEWKQIDSYYTSNNKVNKILPLNYFYDHIGSFMCKSI